VIKTGGEERWRPHHPKISTKRQASCHLKLPIEGEKSSRPPVWNSLRAPRKSLITQPLGSLTVLRSLCQGFQGDEIRRGSRNHTGPLSKASPPRFRADPGFLSPVVEHGRKRATQTVDCHPKGRSSLKQTPLNSLRVEVAESKTEGRGGYKKGRKPAHKTRVRQCIFSKLRTPLQSQRGN